MQPPPPPLLPLPLPLPLLPLRRARAWSRKSASPWCSSAAVEERWPLSGARARFHQRSRCAKTEMGSGGLDAEGAAVVPALVPGGGAEADQRHEAPAGLEALALDGWEVGWGERVNWCGKGARRRTVHGMHVLSAYPSHPYPTKHPRARTLRTWTASAHSSFEMKKQ